MGTGGSHFIDILDSPTFLFIDEAGSRSDLFKFVWSLNHNQYVPNNIPELTSHGCCS